MQRFKLRFIRVCRCACTHTCTHKGSDAIKQELQPAAVSLFYLAAASQDINLSSSLPFIPILPPRPPPSQGDLADPSVCVRDTGPRIGDTSCRPCSRADAAQGRTAGGPSAAPRRQRVNNHMQIARSVWPSAHANAACRSGVCVCLRVFTKRGGAVVGGKSQAVWQIQLQLIK